MHVIRCILSWEELRVPLFRWPSRLFGRVGRPEVATAGDNTGGTGPLIWLHMAFLQFYFSWQESTSTIPNRCKDLIRTSIGIPASSPQCGFFGIKLIPSYQVSFQRMGKDHNIVMLGMDLLGFKRKICAPAVQCCQNTGGSGILICRKAGLCVCISVSVKWRFEGH